LTFCDLRWTFFLMTKLYRILSWRFSSSKNVFDIFKSLVNEIVSFHLIDFISNESYVIHLKFVRTVPKVIRPRRKLISYLGRCCISGDIEQNGAEPFTQTKNLIYINTKMKAKIKPKRVLSAIVSHFNLFLCRLFIIQA